MKFLSVFYTFHIEMLCKKEIRDQHLNSVLCWLLSSCSGSVRLTRSQCPNSAHLLDQGDNFPTVCGLLYCFHQSYEPSQPLHIYMLRSPPSKFYFEEKFFRELCAVIPNCFNLEIPCSGKFFPVVTIKIILNNIIRLFFLYSFTELLPLGLCYPPQYPSRVLLQVQLNPQTHKLSQDTLDIHLFRGCGAGVTACQQTSNTHKRSCNSSLHSGEVNSPWTCREAALVSKPPTLKFHQRESVSC